MAKNTSGARIRLLRERRGLSREQLGALVGVQAKQIGRYERGERHVDSERLRSIADALAVPIANLFDGPGALDTVEVDHTIDQQDSFRLMAAFTRIVDKDTRQYLIHLAETFAADHSLAPLGWRGPSPISDRS